MSELPKWVQIDLLGGVEPITKVIPKLAQVLKRIQNNPPHVITQDGVPTSVLLSPKDYQDMRENAEAYLALQHGKKKTETT